MEEMEEQYSIHQNYNTSIGLFLCNSHELDNIQQLTQTSSKESHIEFYNKFNIIPMFDYDS